MINRTGRLNEAAETTVICEHVKMLQMSSYDKQSSHYFSETGTPQRPVFPRDSSSDACQSEGESRFCKNHLVAKRRPHWLDGEDIDEHNILREASSEGVLVSVGKHNSNVSLNITS